MQNNRMKTFLLLAMMAIGVYACQTNAAHNKALAAKGQDALNDTANYTEIKWIDSLYNFGSVEKGQQVKMTFHFKNTGSKPLIISDARPGCGCTVADFTKEAIPPGGEGEVTGVYDSNKGAVGNIHKSIFVTTNTKHNTQHILIFSGEVKEKKS